MKTITEYFDELKAKTGSDYKSALLMSMDRATLSYMRKRGQIADETALKLAKALNKPEEELLIAAGYARATDEAKKVWENISKKAGFVSALLILNHGVKIAAIGVQCILCKISELEKMRCIPQKRLIL